LLAMGLFVFTSQTRGEKKNSSENNWLFKNTTSLTNLIQPLSKHPPCNRRFIPSTFPLSFIFQILTLFQYFIPLYLTKYGYSCSIWLFLLNKCRIEISYTLLIQIRRRCKGVFIHNLSTYICFVFD
jgi:hypothetical protein